MMQGTLLILICASFLVLVLAAVGVLRLRHLHRAHGVDVHCRRLERDIVMAVGMTMAIWLVTGCALLINPALGDTPLLPGSGGYSIARGTIMLAFGHCLGWGAFLLRRAMYWEAPSRSRAMP